MKSNHELLRAALVGYQHRADQLQAKMAEIRRELGTDLEPASGPEPKKRKISAAGRRRIAAAQRKRWAETKAAAKAAAPTRRRRMSAAGRKRIVAATKKRWAEYRAKKAGMAK